MHAEPNGGENRSLRQQAELQAMAADGRHETLSLAEAQKLLHELEVHQIELELQNEELRRVKSELETEKERRFPFYDLAPAGFFSITEKGLIQEANLTGANLFGVVREALVGQPITGFIYPADQDILYRHHQQLFSTRSPQACELRMVKKDGAIFWVHLASNAVQNSDGVIVCRAVVTDITERKRAEAAAHMNQQQLQSYMDNAGDAIYIIDATTGQIRNCNARACQDLGYRKDQLLTLSAADIETDIPPEAIAGIHQQLRTGKAKTIEGRHRRKDGTIFPVEIRLTCLVPDQSDLLLSMVRDITERKRAAEALERSERNYREIFNSTSEAIFLHDAATGLVLDVNDATVGLYGYDSKAELLATSPGDLNGNEPPYTLEAAFHRIRLAIEEGPQTFEWLARKKSGACFWVEVSLRSAQISGQERILAVVRDTTVRKQAEDKFAKAFLASPAMMTIAGITDGMIIDANDAFEKILGYSRADAIGRTSIEMGLWADLAERARLVPIFLAQGRLRNEEVHFRAKTGQILTCLYSAEAIELNGQQYALAVIDNITERKQAEASLKAAHAKLEALWNVTSLADADVKTVSDHILSSIARMTESEYGFYGFVNAEESVMTIHSWSGEAMQDCAMVDKPQDFPVCQAGVWAEAIRRREPLILNDYAVAHAGKKGLPEGHVRLTNLLVVPFLSHGRITAVAAVANRTTDYGVGDVRQITAFLESVQAIVESKQKEEALRESELQYRTLADSGQALIWTSGLDKKCNYFNQPWLVFTGRTLDQELGNGWAEGVHPDDLARCIEIYTTAFDRRERFSMDYRIRHHSGGYRWVQDNGSPRYDSQGNFLGYIGHGLDITERKRMEEMLQLTRFSIDHASDGLFWMTPDARIVDVNEAACRSLGYTREEFLKLSVADVDTHYNAEKWPQHFAELRQRGSLKFESEQRAKDGQFHPVEIVANYVQYGTEERNCAFVRDITERKLLEEQLRQSQKLESIGQLAGGIAHDYNNLLASTMMNLGMLQGNPNLDAEAQETLRELTVEAQRAANLTRQLLLFSRRSIMEVKVLDLNELVANLLKMLGRLLGEHIAIQFNQTKSLPPVEADPGMLEQVLMNLAVNARDAMPKGGRLTFGLNSLQVDAERIKGNIEVQPGLFICLSVTDTGCGMDEAIQKRIFEPFFTTKDVGKGTGLGLATAYGIVAQHKGWVEVESEVGKGTTFRVFLPTTTKGTSVLVQSGKTEVSRGHETILVVEDDGMLRGVATRVFLRLGYRVLEAANGQAAMKLWQEQAGQIDLLFSDMVMPEGITGLDLAEKLRAKNPSLKVIITSGYNAEMVAEGRPTADGIRYLQKPYQIEVLSKVVRECLEGEICS